MEMCPLKAIPPDSASLSKIGVSIKEVIMPNGHYTTIRSEDDIFRLVTE